MIGTGNNCTMYTAEGPW